MIGEGYDDHEDMKTGASREFAIAIAEDGNH
jgi:hypothetical protein